MSVYVDNFKTIFGIKSNIQVLRNKVLELAIRGKLTSAYEADEKGSELLLLKIEESKLKQTGKKIKRIPFNSPERSFYPNTWQLVSIGDVFQLINGRAFKPNEWSEEGLPIIRIQNLNNNNAPFNHCNFEIEDKFIVNNNDILIGWSGTPGTSFGAFIWKRGKGVLNQHIFKAIPYYDMNKEFLKYSINSKLDEMINKAHGGAGLKHITKGKFEEIIIPIPSLEEQNLIVEKIESYMFNIDKLEETLQKKEHLMEMIPKAVINAVSNCQTGEELNEQLQFVIEHFGTIYQIPESMQELRNVILQLAIEGKLLPQDPSDEPASDLVKKIKAEKDKLIKEGKIKKEKPLPKIEETEVPFEIPESWEWVRLDEVIELISGRDEPVNKCNSNGIGIPYVMGASNIDNNNKLIVERWIDEPKVISEIGDLVITVKGTVGKYFVNEIGQINLSRQTMALRVINKNMLDYLTVWFRSYVYELNTKSQGLIPGISRGVILNSLIPIPSVKEQHRIVKKVGSLMKIIDQMEDKLKRKTALLEKMAN